MTTPDDVLRLIDQFTQQAVCYRSPCFNETQARLDYFTYNLLPDVPGTMS